jgi:hypothetical protein
MKLWIRFTIKFLRQKIKYCLFSKEISKERKNNLMGIKLMIVIA